MGSLSSDDRFGFRLGPNSAGTGERSGYPWKFLYCPAGPTLVTSLPRCGGDKENNGNGVIWPLIWIKFIRRREARRAIAYKWPFLRPPKQPHRAL